MKRLFFILAFIIFVFACNFSKGSVNNLCLDENLSENGRRDTIKIEFGNQFLLYWDCVNSQIIPDDNYRAILENRKNIRSIAYFIKDQSIVCNAACCKKTPLKKGDIAFACIYDSWLLLGCETVSGPQFDAFCGKCKRPFGLLDYVEENRDTVFQKVMWHLDYRNILMKFLANTDYYLVVKVKSPSYEGYAAITINEFVRYYKRMKYDSLKHYEYYNLKMWKDEDWDSAYRDIKQGKSFIISDNDLLRENFHRQNKYYSFTKIIIDNSVINNSKKGIEFFIRTYFDEEGIIKPRFIKDSSHFLTIVKVLFDAGIRIGECDVGFFIEGNTAGFSADRIQDLRFYIFGDEIDDVKFVIPPEYRDSK